MGANNSAVIFGDKSLLRLDKFAHKGIRTIKSKLYTDLYQTDILDSLYHIMLIGEGGRLVSSMLNLFLFVLEDEEKVFDAYIIFNQDTE
jgi:hypothetical protein